MLKIVLLAIIFLTNSHHFTETFLHMVAAHIGLIPVIYESQFIQKQKKIKFSIFAAIVS